MRKYIFAAMATVIAHSSALAADAIEPEVVVNEPAFSWSGIYVVGQAGYESGRGRLEHQNSNSFGGAGGTYDHDGSAFVAGLGIGLNYQFSNNVVLGAELAARLGADIDDNKKYSIYNNFTKTDVNSVVTAKVRLGYAIDRWLPFVTVGYAGADVETSQLIATVPAQTWSGSKFKHGYTLGAGVDYAVTDHVFVGLEYAYTDLGTAKFSGLDSGGTLTQINADLSSHAILARVGVKF